VVCRPDPRISATASACPTTCPITSAAICSNADLLKSGAPLPLDLHNSFPTRPRSFCKLWHISNTARLLIRRLPSRPKQLVTDLSALIVYWPLSRLAALAEAARLHVASFPLSYYRHCSLYTLCTDARDRFGTPLAQCLTRAPIRQM